MFEKDECDFVPALGTHKQMSKVSSQIIDEPAVVELADEDVVVPGLGPSV